MSYNSVALVIRPDDRGNVDTLVDTVIDIVDPTKTTVSLLFVFSRDGYEDVMAQMDIDTTTSGLTPDEVAQRHESVRRAVDRLDSLDIDYEVHGVSGGTLSEKIVRKIEETDADVAVIGGSKRSPTGKAVFGDIPQQVLLNASVPVLYVKRE